MNYTVLLHTRAHTHAHTYPFITVKAVTAVIKVMHKEDQERTKATLGSLKRQEGRGDREMDEKTDALPAGEC